MHYRIWKPSYQPQQKVREATILSRIQLFLMEARKVLQRLLCRHIDWTKAIAHKCRSYC